MGYSHLVSVVTVYHSVLLHVFQIEVINCNILLV